uniref:Uncharacterized protein n=1 Tax=Cacopsylla melanoneura TaxID=428564 RepID=A0A8D8LK04_9HEMI
MAERRFWEKKKGAAQQHLPFDLPVCLHFLCFYQKSYVCLLLSKASSNVGYIILNSHVILVYSVAILRYSVFSYLRTKIKNYFNVCVTAFLMAVELTGADCKSIQKKRHFSN